MKEQTPSPSTDPLASDLAWLRSLMDERDRRYAQRFEAQEAALDKAEVNLREYKASANEFRGTLDDQAGRFMPRPEAESASRNNAARIEQVRDEARGLVETLRKEVIVLQQSQSQGKGRNELSTPLLLLIASLVGGVVVFLIQSKLSQ